MGNNVVDIYMGDPATCIQFGRRFNVDIRVVTPEAEPPVVNSEAEEADPPEDEELRGED